MLSGVVCAIDTNSAIHRPTTLHTCCNTRQAGGTCYSRHASTGRRIQRRRGSALNKPTSHAEPAAAWIQYRKYVKHVRQGHMI